MAIPKLNFPKKGDNGNTTKEKSMSVMHMDLNVTENTNLEVFFTCLGLVHLIVLTLTVIIVIAIGKFTPSVKYYINRVSLSQDYVP